MKIREAVAARDNEHIISIFTVSKAPGWVYVETTSQPTLADVCKNLLGIHIADAKFIPVEERQALLTKDTSKPDLEAGSWVRVRRGPYAKDIGLVLSVWDNAEFCTVQLVPRRKAMNKRRRSNRSPPKLRPLVTAVNTFG